MKQHNTIDADMDTKRRSHRETVSVTYAGERLGVSRGVAYAAVRRGEIPAIRIGKRWLVLKSGLVRLLNEKQ